MGRREARTRVRLVGELDAVDRGAGVFVNAEQVSVGIVGMNDIEEFVPDQKRRYIGRRVDQMFGSALELD
jgi:hypothetical protein